VKNQDDSRPWGQDAHAKVQILCLDILPHLLL